MQIFQPLGGVTPHAPPIFTPLIGVTNKEDYKNAKGQTLIASSFMNGKCIVVDNLQIQRIVVDNLQLQRIVVDNLQIQRIVVDNSQILRIVVENLQLQRIVVDNLQIQRIVVDNSHERRCPQEENLQS